MPHNRRTTLFTILGILLTSALVWVCIWVQPYASAFINNRHLVFAASDIDSAPRQTIAPSNLPLTTAPGFDITLFAEGIDGARGIHHSPFGLVISSPKRGEVYLLQDSNNDGRADQTMTLLSGLNRPSGITASDKWLYIAETDAIVRIELAQLANATVKDKTPDGSKEKDRDTASERIAHFPGGGNHWRRAIGIGPDKQLYVAVGSTCNVCIETDPHRGVILRFNPEGGVAEREAEIVATGIRNSAGFDWNPDDQQLYATDNGRDWLGDDFPPDELNRAEQGGFYGWPYVNGGSAQQAPVSDPDFGNHPNAQDQTSIPPVHHFRAHNAPLGIRFNRSNKLPAKYQRSAFVALHGSWNRSEPDGYKVVALIWTEQGIVEEDFVTGFLSSDQLSPDPSSPKGGVYGRPAELTQAPNGDLYITDDYRGRIYRVAYRGDVNNSVGGGFSKGSAKNTAIEAP
ncbi:MAG: PQQ-dependent sugar dehydrogenase [Porticoccaceae bacterium]